MLRSRGRRTATAPGPTRAGARARAPKPARAQLVAELRQGWTGRGRWPAAGTARAEAKDGIRLLADVGARPQRDEQPAGSRGPPGRVAAATRPGCSSRPASRGRQNTASCGPPRSAVKMSPSRWETARSMPASQISSRPMPGSRAPDRRSSSAASDCAGRAGRVPGVRAAQFEDRPGVPRQVDRLDHLVADRASKLEVRPYPAQPAELVLRVGDRRGDRAAGGDLVEFGPPVPVVERVRQRADDRVSRLGIEPVPSRRRDRVGTVDGSRGSARRRGRPASSAAAAARSPNCAARARRARPDRRPARRTGPAGRRRRRQRATRERAEGLRSGSRGAVWATKRRVLVPAFGHHAKRHAGKLSVFDRTRNATAAYVGFAMKIVFRAARDPCAECVRTRSG